MSAELIDFEQARRERNNKTLKNNGVSFVEEPENNSPVADEFSKMTTDDKLLVLAVYRIHMQQRMEPSPRLVALVLAIITQYDGAK